jgi:hypothetical protein
MNFFFFRKKVTGVKRPATADDDDKSNTNPRPPKVGRIVVMDGQEESCYSAVDAMDSDTEPSPPVRMDWRTDPDKSLSDWTIEVVASISADDETKQSTTYHVHKNILILESEYFQWFFRDSLRATKTDGTIPCATRLELHEKAARFFPQLLDFLYGKQANFSSENATVFHYFGRYFGIRRLRWEAKQFWQKDMNQDTVAIYYKDAITFADAKVMATLEQTCCNESIIMGFKRRSKIFQVPDARLWLHLVKNVGPRHSEQLSRLVAWYLDEHGIDAPTFLELTSVDNLPKIDFWVSFFLMELEQKLFVLPADKLTTLQSRCLETLQHHWRDVKTADPAISTFLMQQPAIFLTELYKRTLAVVQRLSDDDLDASAASMASRQLPHSSGDEESSTSGEEEAEVEEADEEDDDVQMDNKVLEREVNGITEDSTENDKAFLGNE